MASPLLVSASQVIASSVSTVIGNALAAFKLSLASGGTSGSYGRSWSVRLSSKTTDALIAGVRVSSGWGVDERPPGHAGAVEIELRWWQPAAADRERYALLELKEIVERRVVVVNRKHGRRAPMRASHVVSAIVVPSITLCAMQQIAIAQGGEEAVTTLTSELKGSAPSEWMVRVRWRDGNLLASITPWPYDEAFRLFYEPDRLSQTMRGLCPGSGQKIWSLLKPGQDVIVEPTVGGKSGAELQIRCRQQLRNDASAAPLH